VKAIKTPKPAPAVRSLIGLSGVAEHFNVTPRCIQKWVDVGLFPEPLRIGRTVRWEISSLNSWIEAECPPVRKKRK
jgi:predicted DNA-binding transcriptional regulator AlpA